MVKENMWGQFQMICKIWQYSQDPTGKRLIGISNTGSVKIHIKSWIVCIL